MTSVIYAKAQKIGQGSVELGAPSTEPTNGQHFTYNSTTDNMEPSSRVGDFLNFSIGTQPPTYPQYWKMTLSSFAGSAFSPTFSGEDDVMRLGYNVAPGGGRIDSAEPSLYISWESKFYQGGATMMEWHVEGNCIDGVKHRQFTMTMPRDSSEASTGSAAGFLTQVFYLSDFDNTQKIYCDWNSGAITVASGITWEFNGNNQIIHKQLNAAGNAYIATPYIDSSDRTAISGPGQVSSAAEHSLSTFFNVSCIAPSSGTGTIIGATNSTSKTGVINAFSGQVITTVQGRIALANTGSGGTANAEFYASSTNGDSNVRFTNGSQNWVIGLDNSTTADDFVISRAASLLGTNNVFVIDGSTGVATIANGFVTGGVVSLTDAATIATNAALGNTFSVTLGGNRTLGNPTGGINGQKVTWRIKQDATGSRTLTLDTKFRLGADLSSVTLTTTANKTDYLGCIYHSTDDKWDVVSLIKGF